MTKQRLWLALLVLIATLTQCSSCKENVNPDLPPEAQTGAGTFACRVNGQVWIYKDPTDIFSSKPTTNWSFDPSEHGGRLDITAIRTDTEKGINEQIGLLADSLTLRNIAKLDSKNNDMSLFYTNYKISKCNDFFSKIQIDTSKRFLSKGNVIITKLDLKTKIISGRFDCTIFQTGCDTLKITEGRFDLKY
jgi:hypothetical protein